jgi:hypothetical protein
MGDGQSSALAVFPADGLNGSELEDRMTDQDEAFSAPASSSSPTPTPSDWAVS